MWHWNSLWAPAPGDPPAIDDPALWRTPWSPEQAMALQARAWEAMLSAGHSWWTMVLSTWAIPALPAAGQVVPAHEPSVRPAAEPVGRPLARRAPPARKRATRHAREVRS